MTKFALSVAVPAGLDPAKARALLEEAAREQARADSKARLCQAALESDEGLRAWMKEKGMHPFATIVRASVYAKYANGGAYADRQSLSDFVFSCDPRRPVIMRGSVSACIDRYGWSQFHTSANGWCWYVVKRYMRRIKYTCFDAAEFYAFISSMGHRLQKKYVLSYHFYQSRGSCGVTRYGNGNVDGCYGYLKGRRVYMSVKRYAQWKSAKAMRERREQVMVIQLPRKISGEVAHRALKELGVLASRREAAMVIRQILDQPKNGVVNA